MKEQDWQEQLNRALQGAHRLVVLGIGNELYLDDGAGVLLARSLARSGNTAEKLHAIEAGPVPENFTGSIRKINPSHVLLVDAADLKLTPGSIRKIDYHEIGGAGFSTHTLPLNVLADYFEKEGYRVIIVGIQPKHVYLGDGLSPEVAGAVSQMEEYFKKLWM